MSIRVKALNREQRDRLHRASMSLLQEDGVVFHDKTAAAVFKKHGVKVDGLRVHPTEKQLLTALASAPRRFTVAARNPDRSVTVGAGETVFAPGNGAAMMAKPGGWQMEATMEDYVNFVKLVQTSPVLDFCGTMMVEPVDVPAGAAHLTRTRDSLLFCDKPIVGSSISQKATREGLELTAIAFGGGPDVLDRPVSPAIVSTHSPLGYIEEMCEVLMELARHGQPAIISAMVMAGGSGPVSLAGTLALMSAEVLAGVMLTQLINPGSPVIYGSTSSILDMRTATPAIGAPESSVLAWSTAALARHYRLPSRSGGGLTDSHWADLQAGAESTLGLLAAVSGDIDYVHQAVGVLGSFMSMSFEKFLLDEELIGMVKRIHRPITVDKKTLDMDYIREGLAGGEYISLNKTFSSFRSEFYLPRLMNRKSYPGWSAGGRSMADERASKELMNRLDGYIKPDIDPGVEKDLKAYVAKRLG